MNAIEMSQLIKTVLLVGSVCSVLVHANPTTADNDGNKDTEDVVVHYQPLVIFQDSLQSGGKGPEMVLVPLHQSSVFECGEQDGCSDSITEIVGSALIHQYAISRFEITFNDYEKYVHATGRDLPEDQGWGRANRPVVLVSWNDGIRYSRWLSEQTGFNYRLPSVLEWEHAARAGTNSSYWWGNELQTNLANCANCESRWSKLQTAPVGSFKPNPWGIYDIHGNVTEFAQDCASRRKKLPIRRLHDQFGAEPKNFEDCGHVFVMGSSWNQMMISGFRNTFSPWVAKNKRFPPPTQLYNVRYQSFSAGLRVVRIM